MMVGEQVSSKIKYARKLYIGTYRLKYSDVIFKFSMLF